MASSYERNHTKGASVHTYVQMHQCTSILFGTQRRYLSRNRSTFINEASILLRTHHSRIKMMHHIQLGSNLLLMFGIVISLTCSWSEHCVCPSSIISWWVVHSQCLPEQIKSHSCLQPLFKCVCVCVGLCDGRESNSV